MIRHLQNGPDDSPLTFLLAHGAGAGMDSPFMETIAVGLADRGWGVIRFEFPYMQRSRASGKKAAPDRMPVLEQCFCEQIKALVDRQALIIGGKSMGGRVASQLLDRVARSHPVVGGVCLGYPFHPPGKPDQLRTEHLQCLDVPLLVLQGERDTFGRQEEVNGYALSPNLTVTWITDGDHSLKPRKRSGRTLDQNLAMALDAMDGFARNRPGMPSFVSDAAKVMAHSGCKRTD